MVSSESGSPDRREYLSVVRPAPEIIHTAVSSATAGPLGSADKKTCEPFLRTWPGTGIKFTGVHRTCGGGCTGPPASLGTGAEPGKRKPCEVISQGSRTTLMPQQPQSLRNSCRAFSKRCVAAAEGRSPTKLKITMASKPAIKPGMIS